MLTPSAVGAYFDSFSRSCSRTCRKRVSSPIATSGSCGRSQRIGCGRKQQPERLDGLVDRRDGIERRPRQPGQPLAADGGEDRIDEAVEPGELVQRGRPPRRRRRPRRRAPDVAGRRLGQEVDVHPHDRQRRPQLVGHDAQQLGPGRVERGQLGQPRFDSAVSRPFSTMPASSAAIVRRNRSHGVEPSRRRASGR